jgi:predicted DNA-binding transcriptional regulator YafY
MFARNTRPFLPDGVCSFAPYGLYGQPNEAKRFIDQCAKAFEKRTVEPWHLACVSAQWYLLGHDRTRKARRIFVLARMRKVSPSGRKFSKRPAGEKIQSLFRNSFQIWQSENAELEQISLRFSGRAAQLVRERNWHSSQQIQELPGGNLELSLTLNSLEEIIPGFSPGGKIVKWLALRSFKGRLGPCLSKENRRSYHPPASAYPDVKIPNAGFF